MKIKKRVDTMKNKRQVPYHQYIISIVCVAFLAGGGSYIYFNQQVKKIESQETTVKNEDLAKIQSLYDEILTNYIGKVDKKALVDGALEGMTKALDDPYSSYLIEPEAKDLNQSLLGSFEGIGATMSLVNNLPTVAQSPVEDSPAAKAGLKTDDAILEVDGESTEGKTLSEVVDKIRGKKGTEVRLTVERKSEVFEVKIIRDTIPIETVKGDLDKENKEIGNIRITSFNENTFDELKKMITTLRKDGAKSFIIDVRQNPGGLLDQVEKMASMFLKDGQTIIQFEDKNGNKMKKEASKELDGGFKVTEPTVVLVNEGSASASEIFAAALKESGNKEIIGTKTFGKGTVQTVKDLNDKSEIKLTVLKWLTPTGKWIHEKGLEPTIKADYPEYAYLMPISRINTWKQGNSSPAIKNINAVLNGLGYDVDKDSKDFSEKTKLAVEKAQQEAGLQPTGEINEETANQLELSLLEKIKENDVSYKKAIEEIKKQLKEEK